MSLLNDIPGVAELRAAAAKLAEALAVEHGSEEAIRFTHEAAQFFPHGYDDDIHGVQWLADVSWYDVAPGSWCWVAASIRLRLLAEALLLEQEGSVLWRTVSEIERDRAVGALVRAELVAQSAPERG